MPTTTISNQPNRHEYIASPGQTLFAFDFQIFNGSADLEVTVDGETKPFNITLTGIEGGEITFLTPLVGGEEVILQRVLEPERTSQFPDAGPLAKSSLNHEINRLVGLIQDVQQNIERAALLDETAIIDFLETALEGAGSVEIQRVPGQNILVLFGTMIEETVRDTVATFLKAGVGITLFHSDGLDELTINATAGSGGSGLTLEEVQDTIGATCIAGSGISLVYDDGAGTLTITNSGSGYTDEQARDAIGAALVGSNGITITPNDGAETITVARSDQWLQLPVMAGAMEPHPNTSIAPTAAVFVAGASQHPLRTLDFEATTQRYAYFAIPMPKGWNEGQIGYEVLWTSASGAGDVRWALEVMAVSNDDTFDGFSYSAETIVTDTFLAANDLHVSPTSALITSGGSPANGDLLYFRLSRDAADAADTFTGSASLIGIRLYYGRNAHDDS